MLDILKCSSRHFMRIKTISQVDQLQRSTHHLEEQFQDHHHSWRLFQDRYLYSVYYWITLVCHPQNIPSIYRLTCWRLLYYCPYLPWFYYRNNHMSEDVFIFVCQYQFHPDHEKTHLDYLLWHVFCTRYGTCCLLWKFLTEKDNVGIMCYG